ncbi:MAG: hypothetical protein OEV66_06020 [Spirochaetia bacterium]|nr:hypothetical protein [Spirochaetia bacterium]
MNLGKKIFLLLMLVLTLINLNCPWLSNKPIGLFPCEGVIPVNVNFSRLKVYENASMIYTSDITADGINSNGCSTVYMNFYNPPGISVDLYWNSDKTAFKNAYLGTVYGQSYPATIDGTLDTFTQIVGGPYKLVPLRCSTSTPVTLNFSQLQIYQNAALVYTQATSALTANEECGILYLRNFDTASPVTGLNLYWDTGHTAIIDAWIYDTGSQIQSTITAPASPVTPDTFTSITGGTYQLVPVRP